MLFGAVLCDRGATLYCDIDGTGATRIMPGSHLSGRHPLVEEAVNSGQHLGSIPICGPAGSCALYGACFSLRCATCLDVFRASTIIYTAVRHRAVHF